MERWTSAAGSNGQPGRKKERFHCAPDEKYSDTVQSSTVMDVYVFMPYLREEHDELCQLLVGFVGLQLEYLNIGLVVPVLLQKLEKSERRR